MAQFNFGVQNEYQGTRPISPINTIEPVIQPTNPPYIPPPPRPQPPKRVPLPFLNIAGQTRLTNGVMISPNYKQGETGWAIDAEGNAEFNSGIFRGRFEVGGTTITISTSDDIQENLDIIESAGGGTLFLQPGTYVLTADITIPSGVILEGVSRDDVIINCNTSYAVKITGTDVYSTGTVTINNGDTTLEGAGGTVWTTAMIGRYVLLDGLWYQITARTDNDTITIETYQGENLAGSTYVIAATNFTGQLRKVTVTGSTGAGIVVSYAMEPTLYDVVVYGCGTGIDMDYVTYPIIDTVTNNENGVNLNMNYVEGPYINFSEFSLSTTGAGIIMTNQTRNGTIFNSSANDNTGDGISITSGTKLALISLDVSGNGEQGIEFVSGCNDNQITDAVFDGNTSDGIKLTAASDRNIIVATSITNNGGYGINIAASTCDDNQIIAPAFDGNSSGTINDLGTNTTILPQTAIPGYVETSQGSFGGNGSDGALTITTGTTTINCSNDAVVVKNYTSISITGDGVLAFSNPNANGTIIILKSQDGVTLTSSATPMIDASGMGAAGGAAVVTSGGAFTAGNNGTNGLLNLFKINAGVGASTANPAVAAGGAIPSFLYSNISQVLNKFPTAFVGAGGASGNSNNGPSSSGTTTSGAGGRGGGGLIIECAGAWNFTTASGISVAGKNGGNAARTNAADRAGAGGGGGGGYFLALYNTLTANSGTITISGGASGTNLGQSANQAGGGGGASGLNVGGNGISDVVSGGQDGGTGGNGLSSVIINTVYT